MTQVTSLPTLNKEQILKTFQIIKSTGVHKVKVGSVTSDLTNRADSPINSNGKFAIVNLRAIPVDRLGMLRDKLEDNGGELQWSDLNGISLSFNVQGNNPLPLKGETIEVMFDMVSNREKTAMVLRPTGAFNRLNVNTEVNTDEDLLDYFGVSAEAEEKVQFKEQTAAGFAESKF